MLPWRETRSLLTLADLFQCELPEGTLVLAGADHLSREVSWARTLRPRSPGFGSLRGRELAIIQPAVLRALDSSISLARALEQLAPIVSAVAIGGEVDQQAQAGAEAAGVPLFQLPADTDVEALERSIQRAILDSRQEWQRRARALEREFADLALAGHGFEALVLELARRTGKGVALEAPENAPIVRASYRSGSDAQALQRVLDSTQGSVERWLGQVEPEAIDETNLGRFAASDGLLTRIVAPVRDGRGVVGALSLLGPVTSLTSIDRLALLAAAHACAIELARMDASRTALDAAEGDLLERLLRADDPSEGGLIERAERAGLDLRHPYVALAIRPEDGRSLPTVAEAAERATDLSSAPLVRVRGEHALVLWPLAEDSPDEAALRQHVDGVVESLRAATGEARLSAGLGMPGSGLEGLQRTAMQAEEALGLGMRLHGPGRVITFAELGLYRFLLAAARAPEARPEMESFYDDALGKLAAYDRERGTELVPTLEGYLATLGAPQATAERLHVHRNTLLYRLGRIEAVAGVDLRDAEKRLAMHLALRIGQVRALAAARE